MYDGSCLSMLVAKKLLLYISTLLYLYIPDKIFGSATVEELLERGTRLLSTGQLVDALSLYTQAVDQDSRNHLAYYKRGTAYLALGNIHLALPDFDEAIKLDSGFIPAIRQRASLNLKMGKLSRAKFDYGVLASADSEASEKLETIDDLERMLADAQELFADRRFAEALPLLEQLTNVMNFDHSLLEMEATCYLEIGDVQKGIQVMRQGVHLVNNNCEGHLKLSVLMYKSGSALQSLEEIRECLRLDPEHKGCMKHYKQVRKVTKAITKAQEALEASDYEQGIKNAKEILKLEPSNPEYQIQAKTLLCQCFAKSKDPDGVNYCEVVVERFPQNLEFQCDLAESYINAERYDEAIRTCQKLLEDNSRYQRARDLLKKAQKLLKASKSRDYYKILGVPRSATKKEILKAYRKLAAKWHPDKFDGDSKKKAEAKFVEISSAKEVLTNQEMRERFDNGEDPLDPEQQQQHQGPFGPFGGFTFAHMHPFEGGHFEFHFG
ncbi:unnamed protein product [Calicophoron daubneyi]|uniref:J domain-containing protein n=1 Tax=Calicophoron daubneyi TaxID=300641 RepID=A0AAV2TTL4_CALDB